MLWSTVEEYDLAITTTRAAISRALKIGHSHKTVTGVSERSTTEETLSNLRKHLGILIKERDLLAGTGYGGPVLIGIGW